MHKRLISCVVCLSLSSISFAGVKSQEKEKEFIRSIYEGYVLGSPTAYEGVASHLGTKKFNTRLKHKFGQGYDCVAQGGPGDYSKCGYATWELRTEANGDAGKGSISKVNSITSIGNGWYKVSYTDMGWKGVTNVKITNDHGTLKIDDYKRVYSNAR